MKDNLDMYYLYILNSQKADRHYIGITEDLTRRLSQHNGGKVRSSKAYRPYELAYTEQFADKTDARKRELELKKNTWKRLELFSRIATLE